jgi:hypothetical protein
VSGEDRVHDIDSVLNISFRYEDEVEQSRDGDFEGIQKVKLRKKIVSSFEIRQLQ